MREGRRNSAEGYEEEEPYQVEETNYMNEHRSYHFIPIKMALSQRIN